jgi:GTP cyclohydrolase II
MERASSPIVTIYGESTLHCFAFGAHEEDNVLVIEVPYGSDSPLVRVQSACYTGEIFRSLDCDCHEQLDESMRVIHREGGIFVYMICDGRGAGLLTKVRGLLLGAEQGLDTFDAYAALGSPPDPRDYDRVATVLRDAFGLQQVRLLTNNPRKVDGLAERQIRVTRVPLEIAPTQHSVGYLKAKRDKFGHFLDLIEPR